MIAQKSVLSLIDFRREERGSPLVRVDPLHESAVSGTNLGPVGAGRKAKDLIGLLVGHGARLRRSARPRCRITLEVLSPTGQPAVKIRCQ